MPQGAAQVGQVRDQRSLPRGSQPPTHGRPPPLRRVSSTWRYLPHAVAVTFATVVLPLLLVELVEVFTGERSIPLSILMAVALSAAIASAGSWLWQRRPASRDILFGDLMVWGFLRRVRAERRLSEVTRLLGTDPLSADGVSSPADNRIQILERLASSLDARDPFMLGHSRRVARSAEMVAERMGLSSELVRKVQIAASVHDAGKINTPERILNKPSALDDAEFEVIKRHPGDGADMLAPIGDPEVVAMVLHHHERLDGSGYPDGLAGEEIPVGARIIAVADTFDAITSVRPYRAPRKQQAALRILKQESGTRLDPQAVTAFLSCYAGRRTAAWSSFAVAVPERLVGIFMGGGCRAARSGRGGHDGLGRPRRRLRESGAPVRRASREGRRQPGRGPVSSTRPHGGRTAGRGLGPARAATTGRAPRRDPRTPTGSARRAPGGAPEESAPIVNDTPSGTNQPSHRQSAGRWRRIGKAGTWRASAGCLRRSSTCCPATGAGRRRCRRRPGFRRSLSIPDLPAAPGL